MKITVDRFLTNGRATVSRILINGIDLGFKGLEDEHRDKKVSGETRIPAGLYRLKPRNYGGFHARYKSRFPNIHKSMIEIANVPNFTDVLIHIGNTESDTAGCLLVGKRYTEVGGELMVTESTGAYLDIYGRIIDAVINGEAEIEYIDNDKAESYE